MRSAPPVLRDFSDQLKNLRCSVLGMVMQRVACTARDVESADCVAHRASSDVDDGEWGHTEPTAEKNHSSPALGNPVVGGVQDSVSSLVAQFSQVSTESGEPSVRSQAWNVL